MMQKSLFTPSCGVNRLFVWDFIAMQVFKLPEAAPGVQPEYRQDTARILTGYGQNIG